MTQGINSPKAWVFDAYGTLFDVHSVAATAEQLFPGQGKALSQMWRTKQLEYTWLRSLMQRHADFEQVTRDSLAFACAAMGLQASSDDLARLVAGYRTLSPYRDAMAVLPVLQAKMPLAILSNGAPAMLDALIRHNDLEKTFSAVLSVEEVGVFKPDPRVYQLAVDRLKLPAADIGFVSSNGWDAAGAKEFGFTVCWINRSGAVTEKLGVQPDFVLSVLTEIDGLFA
ncbi:MAG: haloacid dehalogenase type II [Betaproteobacteria bacterium]|nr:haloacid dehalogenase type II [Betaproteobacteria bacterium]